MLVIGVRMMIRIERSIPGLLERLSIDSNGNRCSNWFLISCLVGTIYGYRNYILERSHIDFAWEFVSTPAVNLRDIRESIEQICNQSSNHE